MDAVELADLLENSETHRLILGDYQGRYALGVGRDPDNPGAYALILKVPDAAGWPRSVTINGRRVQICVQGGFRRVQPLR